MGREHARDKDSCLTVQERCDYRSRIGDLQWIAGSSRPDLAAPASFSQAGKPTVTDYVEVVPIDANELNVVTYADALFANAEGAKSQGGLLVVAADKQALSGRSACSVLDWRSHRIPRCHTLDAERGSMCG